MSITETEQSPTPEAGPPARHRQFFMRLHFYAGIFVGPFLLVAALSGGLYAIAPTLEKLVYRDYLHVESQGPALPVAEQIRAAQEARPDLTLAAVRPAANPGDTTRVMFTDSGLGPSERHAVFVDPATAEPVGQLTVYGSSGALPVRTWISNLHRSLHLGDPGRIYSELAASWLWLIALGGVYLWVSRYRRMKARGSAKARLLTVDRSTTGHSRTLNWHGTVGIWVTVGLLFLSATGLTWSTYAGANIDELRSAMSWTTPAVSKALPTAGQSSVEGDPAVHAGHHQDAAELGTSQAFSASHVNEVDRVLSTARAAGLDGPVELGIPADADSAFTVAQTRQPWVMSNSAVAVDGATGAITDTSWFPDWPLAAKLSAWGIQLHMGTLFGPANQLALAVLAISLVTMIVRGYVMWWRRRPTQGDRRFGRPPRRGALAMLPRGAAVAVIVCAAAIGWFIPLLGISLVAFVAVDVVVGLLQRHRPAEE